MKYKTEQKIKLYDFLKSHPHDYFTVKEIVDEIAKTNSCMSVSTIYRHLSELINCGKVKKSYRLNDREALYRYIDSDICRNEIHLTCSVCGEVFHLNHEISDLLSETRCH